VRRNDATDRAELGVALDPIVKQIEDQDCFLHYRFVAVTELVPEIWTGR
jgi:hypothetical protein